MSEAIKLEEYSVSEKRKTLRSHLMIGQIKGEANGRVFFGYAKNISRGGIFISTISPRNPGDVFKIDFFINELSLRVNCSVKVIWNRAYQSKASPLDPGMGMKFLDLDEPIRKKIDFWVRQDLAKETG